MNTVDVIRKNIKEMLKKKGLTQTELANTLDVSTVYLSDLLNGKKGDSLKIPVAEKIAEALNISLAKLVTLEDIPYSYSTQTDDIVQNYDFIKFYNVKVSAGFGVDTDEEEKSILLPVEKDFIRQIGYPKEDLSFVAVEGDSMEPTLRNGDRVIVYIPKGPISFVPAIYVIRDAAGVKVKRLDNDKNGSLEVSSDNKFYKTKIYSPDEVNSGNVTIIGRVVGKIGVM